MHLCVARRHVRIGRKWSQLTTAVAHLCPLLSVPPASQVEGADGGRPYVLPGHEGEVTAVAWCPTDFDQIATTADDATIKVCGRLACSNGASVGDGAWHLFPEL